MPEAICQFQLLLAEKAMAPALTFMFFEDFRDRATLFAFSV
jgi:hypothetical protein